MTTPDGPRAVTYATAGTARAYVAAVLGQMTAAPDGPAYLAAAPGLESSARWPALRSALAALLPGVPLAEWTDIPAEHRAALTSRAERTAYLAATHRGLIVIALREMTRRALGPGALAEVAAFTAQGRPVLVFTGRRLTAWPDCRTRPAPRPRTRRVAALLDVPAPPPRPLPTLAASLRALGADGPEVAARASGPPADGPPGAAPATGTARPARPSAGRSVPPPAMFRPGPAVTGDIRRSPTLTGGRARTGHPARPAQTHQAQGGGRWAAPSGQSAPRPAR